MFALGIHLMVWYFLTILFLITTLKTNLVIITLPHVNSRPVVPPLICCILLGCLLNVQFHGECTEAQVSFFQKPIPRKGRF